MDLTNDVEVATRRDKQEILDIWLMKEICVVDEGVCEYPMCTDLIRSWEHQTCSSMGDFLIDL